MPSFDEALQRAGEFGPFQRRVFLLLCLTGITFAFLFVGVVFLGSQPDHYWCRGPSAEALAERCGWSPEEEWNRTAPEPGGDGRCQRYLLEAANASTGASEGALSCTDPLAAFPNRSAPLVPCRRGWRYAQARSTIISEVWRAREPGTVPGGRGRSLLGFSGCGAARRCGKPNSEATRGDRDWKWAPSGRQARLLPRVAARGAGAGEKPYDSLPVPVSSFRCQGNFQRKLEVLVAHLFRNPPCGET